MPRYTVEQGDTLSAIARRNNMTLQQLLRLNPDLQSNPNRIQIGQEIRLGRDQDGQRKRRRDRPSHEEVTFEDQFGGPDNDIWTDNREPLTHDSGRINFQQVARTLGIDRDELLRLNPAIASAFGNSNIGNVWDMDIRTPDGDSFFGPNGNIRRKYRAGLENARVPYERILDRRARRQGYEFPDGERPGPDRSPIFEDDPETEEWNEERIQEAINQDPAYLAMMRAFDLQASDIESARAGDTARLQAQFDRLLPELQHQLRQGTRRMNMDFGGRGLYFGSGRDRDLNILRGESARNEMNARQNMLEAQQARDREAARAITNIENQRAEGTLAASERVTQRRIEDEYPEVV